MKIHDMECEIQYLICSCSLYYIRKLSWELFSEYRAISNVPAFIVLLHMVHSCFGINNNSSHHNFYVCGTVAVQYFYQRCNNSLPFNNKVDTIGS